MKTVTSVTSRNVQYEIGDEKARREKLDITDLPSNMSAFANDLGFITNSVNNLLNYYLKSETYSKQQIDAMLSAKINFLVVEQLPTEEISTSTIYMIARPSPEQEQSDVYDEYIYSGGTWELIGNTYVDLSDYYTKLETDGEIAFQVDAEKTLRENADSTLQGNINTVANNLATTNQNLNAEISARESKNLEHETDISANATAIQAEVTRASGAESTLSDRCDGYDSHVADTNNPHSVTKAQVGLGNVTNVETSSTIESNSDKNITSGAVFIALQDKVDKVTGKGLSDENYTYAEKTKLAGLSNYDDTSLDNRVTANENAITILNGNSSVTGSVDKKIADAIGGVTQIDFQIVASLPAIGVKGVIYFVQGQASEGQNLYNEYVWVGNAYEKIGESTSVIDLTNYYTKAESNALISAKNDKITVTNDATALTDADTFDETATGANPSATKSRTLALLASYIWGKISGTESGSGNGIASVAYSNGAFTFTKGTFLTSHQDISGKVDKVTGKGLSTNDFTTALKTKLENMGTNDGIQFSIV